jgi:2-keto-4-pentenoate hydratase/2-oxohepta-3-ene-1,7-dioic acid hydratase in catechol pathway
VFLQKELKLEIPAVPTLFFKPDTCLTDPLSDIVIPHHATDLEADYEAELTIVIGTTCTNLKSFEEASACILGYTLSNDVTARKHQFQGAQWSYGKGFDTFAPLGPVIVSREYVQSANDKGDIGIQSVLNGQVMQTGLLSDTIFSPEHIVHFLSQGTTLPAGTVILTGTPHGIGVGRDPQVFMQDGDVIVIKGTHGLGSLINTVKYDSL